MLWVTGYIAILACTLGLLDDAVAKFKTIPKLPPLTVLNIILGRSDMCGHLYFNLRFVIACAAILALLNNNAIAASFDCTKAIVTLEKTICSTPPLSKADEEMSKSFQKLKDASKGDKAQALLQEQREWLKNRTDYCAATDAACLLGLYNDRIRTLNPIGENTVPFVIDGANSFQGIRGTCAFQDIKFPPNMALYAAGEYSGRKLDVQIDQSGDQATQFDVIVNSPVRPVSLILGAYEPSIWNIGWTKGTRIIAVVATGYHRQAVAGLPKTTPILISTNDNHGVCGYLFLSNQTLSQVNPYATKIFGKAVDMVYLASAGKTIAGSPDLQNMELFTSRDTPPESFVDKSQPLAGPAAIQDALKKSFLRPATLEDATNWTNRLNKMLPKDALPPVAGGENRQQLKGPYGFNAFVILKPFKFPAGLYGGHLANFYLAEGVPYPEGDPGHSSIYDFNTMACKNVVCR